MSRTLRERARDWRWWGEQLLHFVAIGAAPFALAFWVAQAAHPVAGGAAGAAWIAGVREFEQRPVGSWGDLLVDVAFTIAGGATAGALLLLKGGP